MRGVLTQQRGKGTPSERRESDWLGKGGLNKTHFFFKLGGKRRRKCNRERKGY